MAKERLPQIVAPLGGGSGITSDGRLVMGVTGHGRALSLSDGRVVMPGRYGSGRSGRENSGGAAQAAWWGVRGSVDERLPLLAPSFDTLYVIPYQFALSGISYDGYSIITQNTPAENQRFALEQLSETENAGYSHTHMWAWWGCLPANTTPQRWCWYTSASACESAVSAVETNDPPLDYPAGGFTPCSFTPYTAPKFQSGGRSSAIAGAGMIRVTPQTSSGNRFFTSPATFLHRLTSGGSMVTVNGWPGYQYDIPSATITYHVTCQEETGAPWASQFPGRVHIEYVVTFQEGLYSPYFQQFGTPFSPYTNRWSQTYWLPDLMTCRIGVTGVKITTDQSSTTEWFPETVVFDGICPSRESATQSDSVEYTYQTVADADFYYVFELGLLLPEQTDDCYAWTD